MRRWRRCRSQVCDAVAETIRTGAWLASAAGGVRGIFPPVSAHVYLVPGFFGFANLGKLTYFGHVRDTLAATLGPGTTVHAVRTPPTASLPRRAAHLARTIAQTARDGGPVHLIGHSSGGLDARLLLCPGVALPGRVDVETVARRVQTVVTVSTPHHGTPVASFFASVQGERLLQLLSLSTIYMLRFGSLPLAALLRLGAMFARADRHLGLNSALLDQLFDQLLANFGAGRRRAVRELLQEVHADPALVQQLTLEGMAVFDALARLRPGVRAGSVVTLGYAPGVRSTLAAGLDPSAHATHALYGVLHQLAGRAAEDPPALDRAQAAVLRRAYGSVPPPAANDGVVPTRSQVWGTVIHAATADHLDVIGHFPDPTHVPPHFDWLASGSGFDRERFDAVWRDVARFVTGT